MIAEFLFLNYGQEGSQRTQATTHCLLHLHGFVFLLCIFWPCFNFSFKVRRGRRSKLRTLTTRSEILPRLQPVLFLWYLHIWIVENGEDVAGVGREGEGELFVFICVMPLIAAGSLWEEGWSCQEEVCRWDGCLSRLNKNLCVCSFHMCRIWKCFVIVNSCK